MAELEQQTTMLQEVETPYLVRIGDRSLSTNGFSIPSVDLHLQQHIGEVEESKHWCSPACLSRFTYGRNTESNREAIRRRMSYLRKALSEKGLFLVTIYGARNLIRRFKIYETDGGEEEQLAAREQVRRWRTNGEVSAEKADKLETLLNVAPSSDQGEAA